MMRRWTLREEHILRKYYRRERAKGIKKRMRYRSTGSIYHKAHKMGMRFRPGYTRWSHRELRILDKFYPIEGTDCLRRLPKRSNSAVRSMASDRGLAKPRLWSSEEDAILLQYYLSEGTSCHKRLSNRTQFAIKGRAGLLGLTAEKAPRWSEEENEVLKNHSDQYIEILQTLLPDRTKMAIRAQIGRLVALGELTAPEPKIKPWSDEEDAILRAYYPTEGLKCLKRLPDRSNRSITRRATALGVFNRVLWSQEEKEILKKHPDLDTKALQALLPGRTRGAIAGQQRQLEASEEFTFFKQQASEPWSDEERAILRQYYTVEGPDSCQKRLENRTTGAVRVQARLMGLLLLKQMPWSEEENDILKENCGLEIGELQQLMPGRPQKAIVKQLKYLEKCGKFRIPRQNMSWFDEEDAIIRQYYLTSFQECQKRLPTRSPSAIQHRAVSLGIKRRNLWSEEEIDILKEHSDLKVKALQALLPDRTRIAIETQLKRLEELGEITIERDRFWKPEEDAILLHYYPIEGWECEKRIPNRSMHAVKKRVVRLGLIVPKKRHKKRKN